MSTSTKPVPAEELRISCTGYIVELRMFSAGGGPAKVMMPTRQAVSCPVAMLHRVIAELQAAEAIARDRGLIGGAA